MKRIYFYVLACLLMLVGCQNLLEEQIVTDELPSELYAEFADDTKVQLNSATQTVWTEDDEISVFYKNDANGRWLFMGKTGARGGALTCQDPGTSTTKMDKVVVLYPYSESYALDIEKQTVGVNIPSTQYYEKGSYGVGGNIMVSVGTTGSISLQSVCGWLKVQLSGSGRVTKVTFEGNSKEQVAGDATLNYGDLSLKLLSGGGGLGDDFSLGGELVFGEYATKVTLECGEGVMLDAETPTEFYLVLAPQTFEEGITITAECSDGTVLKKSTSKAIAITRNTIQPMASLKVNGTVDDGGNEGGSGEGEGGGDNTGDNEGGEGGGDNTGEGGGDNEGEGGTTDPTTPKPAANEIWYTSKYEEVITPTKTDIFGALITSNVYENGKGVITFDGNITTIGTEAFKNNTNLSSITIPEGVTSIGNYAFIGCKALTAVTIPEGVTSLGSYAFSSCSAMESFELPQSLLTIGSYTFNSCSKLRDIVIPDNVTTISDNAFSGCSALTRITIGKGVRNMSGGSIFSSCSSLSAVYISDLSAWCKISFGSNPLVIAKNLYLNGQLVTHLIIPEDITTVKKNTFHGCTSIEQVTFHDEVTAINESAFYNCTSLATINIPASVKTIGQNAFYGSTGKSVYIDDLEAWCNITFDHAPLSGGGKLYLNNTLVEDLVIPSTVVAIREMAFNGGSFKSVTIPNRVASIGAFAFGGCSQLKKVTIGSGVTSISNNAFGGCIKLTSITIPDNVITVGDQAFYNCPALARINFGSSVTTLGSKAFYGCTSLSSLVIPDNITTIGAFAFEECSGLTSVDMGKGVATIGSGAFSDCSSLVAVFIKDLAAWCGVQFSNDTSNPLYYAKNLYLNDALVTNLVIPDTVTNLYPYAFQNCTSLKSVTVADTVKSIGESCFRGCLSLAELNIGSGVTTISRDAFYGCTTLPKVVIPANVKTIHNGVFSSCNSLKEIYLKHEKPYTTSYPVGNSQSFYSFSGLAAEYKFYVPMESLQYYHDTWGYTSRIVGYDYNAES